MLAMARGKLARANLDGRVQLIEAEAAALPVGNGTFDAVFMSFVLDLIDTPEIPRVMEECRRALCPGGRLGVAALSLARGRTLGVRAYSFMHAHFPQLVDCRPILVEREAIAAGFSVRERFVRSMWGLPVEILVAQRP
jgi:ubiquinone/menaquinone biosynthesis C-methylase UbiE